MQGPARGRVAEDPGDRLQFRPRGPGVEGDGVRQDDGVGCGMGQAERAAQDMAKLVVQGHADLPEDGAAQPGAVERAAAGLDVALDGAGDWFLGGVVAYEAEVKFTVLKGVSRTSRVPSRPSEPPRAT